jgi:hypothetical protein
MKTIKKDELFNHLGDFLKRKGIVLSDGSYSQRIRQGCNLLADAINATQKTVTRARTEVDKKITKLRGSLHKATAAEKAGTGPEKPPVVKSESKPKATTATTTQAKPKTAKTKRKTSTRKKSAKKISGNAGVAKKKSPRKPAPRKKAA